MAMEKAFVLYKFTFEKIDYRKSIHKNINSKENISITKETTTNLKLCLVKRHVIISE